MAVNPSPDPAGCLAPRWGLKHLSIWTRQVLPQPAPKRKHQSLEWEMGCRLSEARTRDLPRGSPRVLPPGHAGDLSSHNTGPGIMSASFTLILKFVTNVFAPQLAIAGGINKHINMYFVSSNTARKEKNLSRFLYRSWRKWPCPTVYAFMQTQWGWRKCVVDNPDCDRK